jgi:DNA topoisomerase-1
MLKLPANGANGKFSTEELSSMEIEDVKKIIIAQDPKAFDKKGAAKKGAAKKGTAKKSASKKTAPKRKP